MRQGRVEQWRVRSLSKQASSSSTGGVRGLHNEVSSEVVAPKVAMSRDSPTEVLSSRNVEGLHSSEVVTPRERQVLKAVEGPVDLDVGLKLILGQEKELANFNAFSRDPLLICEVGQEMGLKACEDPVPTLVGSTGSGRGSEKFTDLGPNGRDGPDIGQDLDASDKSVSIVLGGYYYAGPSSVSNSDFLGVDFSNVNVPPSMVPSSGFHWQFLVGVWALVLALVIPATGVERSVEELKDLEGIDTQSTDGALPDHISESDASVLEFEMNLLELLPDLPVGKSSSTADQPKGTRRSGRPKKPPSRFDEKAEQPKSSKKKVSSGEALEGTSLKPLLISDCSNV